MLVRIDNARAVDNENGFAVTVPDIWSITYKSKCVEAKAEIEGGRDNEGCIDWLLYESTLVMIKESADSEPSLVVLDRMIEGMKALGMRGKIE